MPLHYDSKYYIQADITPHGAIYFRKGYDSDPDFQRPISKMSVCPIWDMYTTSWEYMSIGEDSVRPSGAGLRNVHFLIMHTNIGH